MQGDEVYILFGKYGYIYMDCEECNHTNKIPIELCTRKEGKKPEYNLTEFVQCEKCGKAVVGDLVTGSVVELVTSSMGKNKVMVTCLK